MGNAVDAHAHIIDPDRFAYWTGPGYKPPADEAGDRQAFDAVCGLHGTSHALLVQPSCYGYENSAMLEAVAHSGGRHKAIAVVPPDAGEEELVSLKRRGVVGIRLNLIQTDPDALSRPDAERLLQRANALGWFVQVFARADTWRKIAPVLRHSGARIVIDHLGTPDPRRGLEQRGFQAVLALGRETNTVIKLSAPHRVSVRAYPYEDVDRFVAALIDAFGLDRCIWGSDWPFINTRERIDYGGVLDCLDRWLPDPGDRNCVLWGTPARLFGFAGGAATEITSGVTPPAGISSGPPRNPDS